MTSFERSFLAEQFVNRMKSLWFCIYTTSRNGVCVLSNLVTR